ncbi:unnamed protein product [Linum trigynum]|uniref:Uncharacterized protein n=1 Tax=Linum trigynum TaxID=586398 RepID=A0AAV2F0D3_9ROSI
MLISITLAAIESSEGKSSSLGYGREIGSKQLTNLLAGSPAYTVSNTLHGNWEDYVHFAGPTCPAVRESSEGMKGKETGLRASVGCTKVRVDPPVSAQTPLSMLAD